MTRGCHADRPVQQSFAIDGCLTDDAPIADVFAVWVERVADLNAAIDAHNAVLTPGHAGDCVCDDCTDALLTPELARILERDR